jgi:UDP-arabinose 4-epimerase
LTENILVTGGGGYVGSHTCKMLARAGLLPVSYDNLTYGHEWAVRWGPLEKGDLLERDRLASVLRRYRPRAVIHFAAYAYVAESVQDPGKYYHNNVVGTLSLLEAMRAVGVNGLVFSSTCATYGEADAVPIKEDHLQRPMNPYGHSKHMIEQILRDFARAYDLNSVALRYFNAAGADPEGEIGEDHTPETHLIPLVLRATVEPNLPVTVFGTDYPTPDGTCIRDYVHVEDLAKAHVLALNRLQKCDGFSAFNLGTGRGHSVRQIIETAGRITGRKVQLVEGLRRRGDPPVLVADPTLARRVLDWQPRWTDIDDIIKTAWQWHQRKMP